MRSMVEHVAAVALEAGVGRVASPAPTRWWPSWPAGWGWAPCPTADCPGTRGSSSPAASCVRSRGRLYLGGDLPLLTAAEVRRLADEAQAGTVVVGRAGNAGTNALAVSPAAALAPRFGEPRSSQVHARAAERAGDRVVMLDLPGVALDVDTPDDLARAGLAG